MFKNKFYRYRPEVCLEIWKIGLRKRALSIASYSTEQYYNTLHFRTFFVELIFKYILRPSIGPILEDQYI